MTAPGRRVPAAAVALAYCQLDMLRLLAEGVPKADASYAGWLLFGRVVGIVTGERVADPGRVVATPTTCLHDSATSIRDALAMAWESFTEQHGIFNPSVVLPQDVAADLVWLTDAVVRIANGVDVLDAAVQARAWAMGWPRRRREPAEPAWLTAQITRAQSAAWAAMVEQESWRPRRLPPQPPAATVTAPAERR